MRARNGTAECLRQGAIGKQKMERDSEEKAAILARRGIPQWVIVADGDDYGAEKFSDRWVEGLDAMLCMHICTREVHFHAHKQFMHVCTQRAGSFRVTTCATRGMTRSLGMAMQVGSLGTGRRDSWSGSFNSKLQL